MRSRGLWSLLEDRGFEEETTVRSLLLMTAGQAFYHGTTGHYFYHVGYCSGFPESTPPPSRKSPYSCLRGTSLLPGETPLHPQSGDSRRSPKSIGPVPTNKHHRRFMGDFILPAFAGRPECHGPGRWDSPQSRKAAEVQRVAEIGEPG